MESIKNYVGWEATLYIWWGQVWRVLAANIAIYFLATTALPFLMPMFHLSLRRAFEHEEGFSLKVILPVETAIFLWAGRESLTDSYARFSLTALHKTTRRSMFGFDKRLAWHVYAGVCWAQAWRMLLAPGAAVLGSLASAISSHRYASNYSHFVHPMVWNLSLYAMFVFSLWATRESLADRYRAFRFAAEPKSFYP